MSNPRVGIVIVNYNGWGDTLECLESLEAVSYENFFVVVVDNCSPQQENRERLRAYRAKRYSLDLLFLDENLGFSGGNNAGIHLAREEDPEYLMLLNNDTVVEAECISHLVKFLREHPRAWASPFIYYYNEQETIWFGGGKFHWIGGGRHLSQRAHRRTAPRSPVQSDFLTGAAVMFPVNAIAAIGLLDERYFLYYEDVEYSLRARKAHYKLYALPQARVWHKKSAAAKKLGDPLIMRYHHRNILLLAYTHIPVPLRPLIRMWVWRKTLLQKIKIVLFPSKKEIAAHILSGFDDYYNGRFGRIK